MRFHPRSAPPPAAQRESEVLSGQETVVRRWRPTASTRRWWGLLGSLVMVVAAVGFMLLYARTHAEARVRLSGWHVLLAIPLTLLLTLLLLILHELIHGAVMRLHGVTPRYGVGSMAGVPVVFATARGHLFSRRDVVLVSLAPLVSISLLGALVVALLPYGGWLILPLVLHAHGSAGDLWMSGLVLRQPRGTLVEDLADGLRFHRPAGS